MAKRTFLDSVAQEVATSPDIVPMVAVWLSGTVNHFRQEVSTLHCGATPAHFFQDWTFATMVSIPSVSQVGEPQPPLRHLFRLPVLAHHLLCAKGPDRLGHPQPQFIVSRSSMSSSIVCIRDVSNALFQL